MSGQAFLQFIGFFAANITVASLISYIVDSRTNGGPFDIRSEKFDG